MKSVMLICLLFTLTAAQAGAQDMTTVRKKHFNTNSDNVAIKGYDPVAYYKTNSAVKGTKDLAVYHQGIIYYFSTPENKEDFKKNPARYEPEYGGWCAYAMGAKGEKVNIDPATFKILNGKLYLFYNRNYNNTLNSWNKDETSLKTKGDANWKGIFN
jgi:YHS domain-containing protein